MSGVRVIRYLLANHAPLTAVIPATRIMAGNLPLNTALPAISVTQVDSVPYNTIRTNESNKLHTDRVQVTAYYNDPTGTPYGTGYPGLKAAMVLILAACPSQYGTVNNIKVHSIQPQSEGPDFQEDKVHSSSRDFIVRWAGA